MVTGSPVSPVSPLELITFEILAAERLRFKRSNNGFDNHLLCVNVVNILSTSPPDILILKNFQVELFTVFAST